MEQNSFQCITCQDVKQNSFLTNCCSQLVCFKCIQVLKQQNMAKCPNKNCHFKQKFSFREASIFVKRVIGNLPKTCPKCKTYKTTVSEFKYHPDKCPMKKISCDDEKCESQFLQKDYLRHIGEVHKNEIVEMFKSVHGKSNQGVLIDKQKEREIVEQISQLNFYKQHNKNLGQKYIIKEKHKPKIKYQQHNLQEVQSPLIKNRKKRFRKQNRRFSASSHQMNFQPKYKQRQKRDIFMDFCDYKQKIKTYKHPMKFLKHYQAQESNQNQKKCKLCGFTFYYAGKDRQYGFYWYCRKCVRQINQGLLKIKV